MERHSEGSDSQLSPLTPLEAQRMKAIGILRHVKYEGRNYSITVCADERGATIMVTHNSKDVVDAIFVSCSVGEGNESSYKPLRIGGDENFLHAFLLGYEVFEEDEGLVPSSEVTERAEQDAGFQAFNREELNAFRACNVSNAGRIHFLENQYEVHVYNRHSQEGGITQCAVWTVGQNGQAQECKFSFGFSEPQGYVCVKGLSHRDVAWLKIMMTVGEKEKLTMDEHSVLREIDSRFLADNQFSVNGWRLRWEPNAWGKVVVAESGEGEEFKDVKFLIHGGAYMRSGEHSDPMEVRAFLQEVAPHFTSEA